MYYFPQFAADVWPVQPATDVLPDTATIQGPAEHKHGQSLAILQQLHEQD